MEINLFQFQFIKFIFFHAITAPSTLQGPGTKNLVLYTFDFIYVHEYIFMGTDLLPEKIHLLPDQ